MPVLGVIFLRHAANRFDDAQRQIDADQASARRAGAGEAGRPSGHRGGLEPDAGTLRRRGAVEEDEDFDFEQTMRNIHIELADLNEEAAELAARIQANFAELVA